MTDTPETSKPAGWDYLFRIGYFPPRYKALAEPNRTVVEWAETLPPSASVLDVGCGVGRHTLYLGSRGFRMSGTDISPEGITQTQKACAEHQLSFEGRVADMTALPWADQTFDAVLSTSTVCHHRLVGIRQTMAEVWRVLKPDGLFLVDFIHKGTLAYQEVLQQSIAGTLHEVEPNTFIDESPTPDLNDDAFIPHHYCDESEVYDLLQAFTVLKVWADLPPPSEEGALPRRGHWVASVRKQLN